MPAAECAFTYCTVRFYINKHGKKRDSRENTWNMFVCYRQTAKERDVDAERQKEGKRLAGARVPSKGGRGTARYLVG